MSITSTGDITVTTIQGAGSTGANGLFATAYSVPGPTGALTIDSRGNITATAISGNGSATVNGMGGEARTSGKSQSRLNPVPISAERAQLK